MKKKAWFECWFNSPYYKVLYQNRDMNEAEDFTEALVAYLKPGQGARMLDIGCGEGRFAVQLARKGYDVIGIDLAENRILKAKEKETDTLHFFVHDMRMPFYINYFDFSFNFFTSFGYFATQRDNVLAARSFAGGLKRGGRLVVDYLNRDLVLQQMKAREIIHREDIDFDIQKDYDGSHIIKHIRFTDREGNPQHFTERVSAFGLEDFRKLFEEAGLTLEATFGDYQLNDFDNERSSRLIMVFKK
ncbi:MAG: class I SAM-dependent methyltransferase [Chitinophagaceae bacterium]